MLWEAAYISLRRRRNGDKTLDRVIGNVESEISDAPCFKHRPALLAHVDCVEGLFSLGCYGDSDERMKGEEDILAIKLCYGRELFGSLDLSQGLAGQVLEWLRSDLPNFAVSGIFWQLTLPIQMGANAFVFYPSLLTAVSANNKFFEHTDDPELAERRTNRDSEHLRVL